jgi:para-aminobenzoate synthetase component 1
MKPALHFRPRVARVPGDPLLAEILGALLGGAAPVIERPVLLDSAAGEPRRFSLLGFDPVVALAGPSVADLGALRASCARLEPRAGGDPLPAEIPFAGGFLGALAYELGGAGEGLVLPPEPWGLPAVVGGLYTDFFARDELRGRTWLVLGDEPGDDRPPAFARRGALLARLAEPAVAAGPVRALGPLARRVSSAAHQARIARVQAQIAAGEIYQANVAHRLTCEVEGRPFDLYRRLRVTNPAPYMGYAEFPGGALLSSSPELLLELGPDPGEAGRGARVARTRPIKGTAARARDALADERAAAELCASAKERAELAMSVDLERNDLGRTARAGSVRVEEFPALRTYAAVHHLTADVVAEPRPECDAWDVLAALFPGGSVTGAPKLASMAAIAELEGEGRGFFCGSLGFVDTRGAARFNVLIRSVQWRPSPARAAARSPQAIGEVSFRVGGGITFASDPRAEDRETLAKAAALVAAFDGRASAAEERP